MNSETLKNNIEKAVIKTIEFAEELSWNSFSDNFYFIIRPNSIDDSEHLDDNERINLKQRIIELNKILTIEQVVERLCIQEKVPVWIDISIEKSQKEKTVFELMTSRRFRKEDYNYKNSAFPPFHIAIPIPPFVKENEKFNINWKHQKLRLKINAWKWRFKNRKWINKTLKSS